MSSEIEEKPYFVQATRKLDKRKIFIKSTIKLETWVDITDVLVDCEFVLSKITEREFLTAIEKSHYIYYVTPDNHFRFQSFIQGNYDKIKKPQ